MSPMSPLVVAFITAQQLTPFSEEFVKHYGPLGALVIALFWIYRRDVDRYTEQWRGQTELVITVLRENSRAMTENAAATRSQGDVLRQMEHRLRDEDRRPPWAPT